MQDVYLFIMRRSFAERSVSAFVHLYNTLVWPHLENDMRAYSQNLVADTDCLEQIQRLATRLLKGFHRLPYEERLRQLGLHSLNRCRFRGDLVAAYNMFSGGLGLNPSLFFLFRQYDRA